MTRVAGPARLMVAISDELRSKLEAAASRGRRSLSAEMVLRLEASFEADNSADMIATLVEEHQGAVEDFEKRIADLERRMTDVYHMSGWRDYPGNEAR